MHFEFQNFKRIALMLQALVCLTHAANSYAVDWQDPCTEEIKMYCAPNQEREECLLEHRDNLMGSCQESVFEYLSRHPEVEENENVQENYFWNNPAPQKTIPTPKPKRIAPEVNCDGANSLNSECYSRW